jgi:hypothetical protein
MAAAASIAVLLWYVKIIMLALAHKGRIKNLKFL